MTQEQRKEKADLQKALIELLANTPDDSGFYKRLIWANQIIANTLSKFELED